jgi:proteasome assembly chaperone 2
MKTPGLGATRLSMIKTLQIPEYATPKAAFHSPMDLSISSTQAVGDIPHMPGGGLSRRILSAISAYPASWNTPVAALVQFVLEGDNRSDAGLMASVVTRILGGVAEQIASERGGFKEPKSWSQGLFGTPHDQSLYG